MAKPIECNSCNLPATVHLTQIVNGQIKKIDLCENCAKEKGVTDPEGFSLAELLSTAGSSNSETKKGNSPAGQGLVCESCGFSQHNLNKLGRMGCPDCYKTFGSILKPMLTTMHVGTGHCGKFPEFASDRMDMQKKLSQLEKQIAKAIEEERYEDAALCRDQIRQLAEPVTEA